MYLLRKTILFFPILQCYISIHCREMEMWQKRQSLVCIMIYKMRKNNTMDSDEGSLCWSSKIFHFLLGRETLFSKK